MDGPQPADLMLPPTQSVDLTYLPETPRLETA